MAKKKAATKRAKRGLVVTTKVWFGGVHEISAHGVRPLALCERWHRALRRAGWRPTDKPAQWRVTMTRVRGGGKG